MRYSRDKKITLGIFTYDFFPIFGGQGRHIYELYKQNQTQEKVNMYIFSPNVNSLENHISIFPETKKSKLKNIEYSWKVNRTIENLIKKYQLDVVHIHGGPGGIFLFKKLSVPTIYTVHHTYWQQFHYIKNQSWKYIFYLLEKASYKKVEKIICVSKDTQKIITDYYAVPHKSTDYIPNGINLNNFKSKKNSNKENNILYVGRIDQRKGVDFLVKSMVLVHQKNPSITLHIVGEGIDKKKLEKFSKENNLPIIFHGGLSDEELQKLYEHINIQIVPSVFEGFGISVLEGMAKGIPIIATDVDGIRSILKNNYSGILVPYNNEHALSDSIIQLFNNPLLRQKLINNAFNELQEYNWQTIYTKTLSIYEELFT